MFLEKNPQARKELFLVTKHDGGEMTDALNQSLEKLKTDYVDMYFLHGGTGGFSDETKAWAEKMKAAKKIRFFGFSTHSNMEQNLQDAAKAGWIDGIMLKYDYRLMQTDAMKSAMDAATKAGIGLTAMKTQSKTPIGTDTEADLKLGGHFIQSGFSQQQAQLKALWENPQIATICSQMGSVTVLHSNIAAALDKTSAHGGGPCRAARIRGGDALAALRRLHAILRNRAQPSSAGGRRDALPHVSPQLRRPGTGADGVPPNAGNRPARSGRLRLRGG